MRRALIVAAALLLAAAPARGQTLTVQPERGAAVRMGAAELAALPRRTVRGADHGQPEAAYEGVLLSDLLRRAEAPTGHALRGPQLSLYVVAVGADGYRAVFALAELDSSFTRRAVIVADRKDGRPLDAREGPLRIVVEGERRPARWVRQLTRIYLVRAPEPR